MFTILAIAFMQMPQFAILPATNIVATEVFPGLPIQTIQTAMSLPGFVCVIAGVVAALLLRCGVTSKRFTTIAGLFILVLGGITAIFLNSSFWHLCLMNVFIGAGLGTFLPSSQSIMFDNFDEDSRRFIAGIQSTCINGGGLVMTFLCGILTSYVWYGGHLLMFFAIPALVVSCLFLPRDRKMRFSAGGDGDSPAVQRTKLPFSVYSYSLLVVVFFMMFNVATINISTHLSQGGTSDPFAAGVASALSMAGGAVFGLLFPTLSKLFRDHVFALSFLTMGIGHALFGFFPSSLIIGFVASFICGATMSIFMPRCILNASILSDPTNSSTVTVLICCVSPGVGHFLSPLVITNLTLALGGESTQFRFRFTAVVCLALTVLIYFINLRRGKRW